MMLLPFWTDGCIGSMEGLFFESSATTPYHFLASSALSAAPSRPVRNLRYDPLNVDKGVQYMQLLGVKYYMAFSPAAVKEARQQTDLTRDRDVRAVGDLRGRRLRPRHAAHERARRGQGCGQGREELAEHVGGLLPRPDAVGRRARRERPEGLAADRRQARHRRRRRSRRSRSRTSRPTTTASASTSTRSACRCS